MKNKKSAKDIAFEKEREKFRSKIRNLEYQVNDKDKQIEELKETLYQKEEELFQLNDWVQRLLEYTELSEEDMKKIIEKEKTTAELISDFQSMQNLMTKFRF